MSDEPSLLAAGPAHADLLAALHALAFADPAISGPAWDAASFSSLLALPGVEGWISLLDGEPCGLSLWRLVLDEAELLTIGTVPAARGHGIGRRLLRDGLCRMAGQGAEQVFLEVAVTNTTAIALYASAGFTIAGRRRGYYHLAGDAIDAHVMVANPQEMEMVKIS